MIKYNNVTINSVNYLGKNVSLVTQNFGLPNSIEDYYFEMQDVMTKKYKYNGILFYIVNNNVDSFEISNKNYTFSNYSIKVGDNIDTLYKIFPLSYSNRGIDSLGVLFSDADKNVAIYYNINNLITLIRIGDN